jgi:hypothetical protein
MRAKVLLTCLLLLVPSLAYSSLTIDDVLYLSRTGIGDQVIIAEIRASGQVFRLDPEEIVELKREGVSEAVIQALIETGIEESHTAEDAEPTDEYDEPVSTDIYIHTVPTWNWSFWWDWGFWVYEPFWWPSHVRFACYYPCGWIDWDPWCWDWRWRCRTLRPLVCRNHVRYDAYPRSRYVRYEKYRKVPRTVPNARVVKKVRDTRTVDTHKRTIKVRRGDWSRGFVKDLIKKKDGTKHKDRKPKVIKKGTRSEEKKKTIRTHSRPKVKSQSTKKSKSTKDKKPRRAKK